MKAEPQQEHRWLERMVGAWTYEGEYSMGPGQPSAKHAGSEVVRSLGGLWTIGEGEGEAPDGTKAQTVMTLGYDPEAKRFVGTFIASMMTYLWIYGGSLDESGEVLSLDAEGPSFDGKGLVKYRDSMEFVDDGHRILTSSLAGEDGQWQRFMTTHYRRKV